MKTVTVEDGNGARVVLCPRSITNERVERNMMIRSFTWYQNYAEDAELAIETVDAVLTDFLVLSARAVHAEGLDFEFIKDIDDAAAQRQKFEAYVATDHYTFIRQLIDALNALDAPADPDKAPDVVLSDPKEQAPAPSGKKQSRTTS